ncbi:MAG: response regulator, partial [Cytophagaceae bacterium]
FMAEPVKTWTDGDAIINNLVRLADRAHQQIAAGNPESPELEQLRAEGPILGKRLADLTSAFTYQLGEASRRTQNILLSSTVLIWFLLIGFGTAFIRSTGKSQTELELRVTRLIQAVNDGIVTVDENNQVVMFNRAAETMFGLSASAATGHRIDRFIRSDTGLNFQDRNAIAHASSKGTLHRVACLRKDGSEFNAEVSFSNLKTDNGIFTTVVLRDVTAQEHIRAEKLSRQAVEATSKAKTEFLSRMSHELRTPLNAVVGFSRLILQSDEGTLSKSHRQQLQHIEDAGTHLTALVNDVLDLSKIEANELLIETKPVDLLGIIEEASMMLSPMITEAGIKILLPLANQSSGLNKLSSHTTAENSRPWVEADAVRLRQILVNLLSNAIKYNKPGGSVDLSWLIKGNHCELALVDTGRGIAANKLESLFEPFNRLGAEGTSIEGTGIGLVISKKLANSMGADLDITSTYGQGTTATLTLKLADAPKQAGKTLASEYQPANGSLLNVLYAEDNEVNAELVKHVLMQRSNVILTIASDGKSAIRLARKNPPDLMLVDMNLGDMTGIEVATELRLDPATASVHLIALSADALPEQIATALNCGFENYLTKPIDFGALIDVLDSYT